VAAAGLLPSCPTALLPIEHRNSAENVIIIQKKEREGERRRELGGGGEGAKFCRFFVSLEVKKYSDT
jgi:hypothetical protein